MDNVWIYKFGSDLKVFKTEYAAQQWIDKNDPEGVAFEYELITSDTAADSINAIRGDLAALSRQAPVPTSGAVKVAQELEETCCAWHGQAPDGSNIFTFDKNRAAAIIQQYGEHQRVDARRQAGLPDYPKPPLGQPPAADGKLREALEAARPNIVTLNWNTENEYDWLVKQIDAALAQPASGGGNE